MNGATVDDWYDTQDENKKQPRRDAADDLLADAWITDGPGSLREALENSPTRARDEFEARYKNHHSGVGLPADVKVICVDADLRKRANLVVLCIPPPKTSIHGRPTRKGPSWKDSWLAAWPPYKQAKADDQ
jgi:hypothetical protein